MTSNKITGETWCRNDIFMVLWHGRACKEMLGKYCELANKTTEQLYKVATPCMDDHQFRRRRKWISWRIIYCLLTKNVLKCLYPWHVLEGLTFYGLWTNLRVWWRNRQKKAYDKRLARLIAYIHHRCEYRRYCYVGNTAQHCSLGLFQDSDFAGDLEDPKSTSGGILCIFGSQTFVPISLMCKKHTSVAHSSTEAEVIFSRCRITHGWDSRSRSLGFCDWSISFLTKPNQQNQRCERAKERTCRQLLNQNMQKQMPTTNTNVDLTSIITFHQSEQHSGSFAMLSVFEDNEAVIKGLKSHNETCVKNSQSCFWLVVWQNQFRFQNSDQVHRHQTSDCRHTDKRKLNTWRMEQSSLFVQHHAFQLSLLRKEFQIDKVLQHDGEKDAGAKRRRKKCGKIEIYSDEPVFSCSDKFLIRKKSDCIQKSRDTHSSGETESRMWRNSKSDAASSSQARLKEAYLRGFEWVTEGPGYFFFFSSGNVWLAMVVCFPSVFGFSRFALGWIESNQALIWRGTSSFDSVSFDFETLSGMVFQSFGSCSKKEESGMWIFPNLKWEVKRMWLRNLLLKKQLWGNPMHPVSQPSREDQKLKRQKWSPSVSSHNSSYGSSILDRQGDLRTRTRWPCEWFGCECAYLRQISECHSSSSSSSWTSPWGEFSIREDLSLGQKNRQSFRGTGKLISEHREITGRRTIDFKETYIFSDSVLCVGKMGDDPIATWKNNSKRCSENKSLEGYESNRMNADGVRVENIPRNHSVGPPQEDSKINDRTKVWTGALQR